jgi:hypothetical protein
MASCKSIIITALSKLGVASALKGARDEDLQLGLQTLQSKYRSLIASGALGRALPVTVTGNYTTGENERILKKSGHAMTISLPETVTDRWGACHDDYLGYGALSGFSADYGCSRVDHRPRPPRDGAFVVINDEQTGRAQEWLYDSYVAKWLPIHDLSLSEYGEVRDAEGNISGTTVESTAPLSAADTNGLAAALALSLSDHFGAQPSPMTIRDASVWQQALVNRFGLTERERPDRSRFF